MLPDSAGRLLARKQPRHDDVEPIVQVYRAGLVGLAASITFLLSDDGVNVNGQVLASDGGWSVA